MPPRTVIFEISWKLLGWKSTFAREIRAPSTRMTAFTSRPVQLSLGIRSWIYMRLQAAVRLGGVWSRLGSGGVDVRLSLLWRSWQRWRSHASAKAPVVQGAARGWPRTERAHRRLAMLTQRRNPKEMKMGCAKQTTLGTWSMGQGHLCRSILAGMWPLRDSSGYSQVMLRRATRRSCGKKGAQFISLLVIIIKPCMRTAPWEEGASLRIARRKPRPTEMACGFVGYTRWRKKNLRSILRWRNPRNQKPSWSGGSQVRSLRLKQKPNPS